jgi:hypothetical protein
MKASATYREVSHAKAQVLAAGSAAVMSAHKTYSPPGAARQNRTTDEYAGCHTVDGARNRSPVERQTNAEWAMRRNAFAWVHTTCWKACQKPTPDNAEAARKTHKDTDNLSR